MKVYDGLLNAQKAKNDEFFTIYEQFEILVQHFLINQLKDKVIYCPCDSDWSNIVKVLKDYKERLQYKELIYTNDDFNLHDDLFDKADIVITNPPFSILKQFFDKLKKYECEFFVYGNVTAVCTFLSEDIVSGKIKYIPLQSVHRFVGNHIIQKYNCTVYKLMRYFITPNGEKKEVATNIYTNILGINMEGSSHIQLTKTLNDINKEYIDGTTILNINRWTNFPKDYYGIAAISPVFFCNWHDKFEVISCQKKLYKCKGKNLFKRWLVRLKGSGRAHRNLENRGRPRSEIR